MTGTHAYDLFFSKVRRMMGDDADAIEQANKAVKAFEAEWDQSKGGNQ